MTKRSKITILRENGTLNVSPDNVLDVLFHKYDFFDPHDLLQVKYEMIRRVLTDEWTITRATKQFGFSRPAFYQILKAFNKEGLLGLFPKKRGPKAPHKLTSTIIEFIKKTAKQSPSVTSNSLAVLVKSKFGISIHCRTIKRIFSHQKKITNKNY